jgi:hypothetical protein
MTRLDLAAAELSRFGITVRLRRLGYPVYQQPTPLALSVKARSVLNG